MTFFFHSISDLKQRQTELAAHTAKPKGRKPSHRTFLSIFQGGTPKWEGGILWLQRESGGGRAEKESGTQNRDCFTVTTASLAMGTQPDGHPGANKMCLLCMVQVCLAFATVQSDSDPIVKSNHQPWAFHTFSTGEGVGGIDLGMTYASSTFRLRTVVTEGWGEDVS
jgi:hypothetical protein